jgi:hypothetical protein
MAIRLVSLFMGTALAARDRLHLDSRAQVEFRGGKGDGPPTPPVYQLYEPANVSEAWTNHVQAFGGQDLDKIMLDYDAYSVARVHVIGSSGPAVATYKGTAEIRVMFAELFAALADRSQLDIPHLFVEEEPGQVFLIWNSPTDGHYNCTDTFIFDDALKIRRQNIVVKYSTVSASKEQKIRAGWANHFSAFGEQNLTKILLDYNDQSVVRVYSNAQRSETVYTGLQDIAGLFTGLFSSLGSAPVEVPVVEVDPAGDQVFLVWKAPSAGFVDVTDTFIFDADGLIVRQNIVIF